MKKTNTRALAESAVLIALAFVLSYFKYEMPQGGSVTPASMLPILLIGIRWGTPWGLGAGLVYGLLQMLQSFYAPPVESTVNYFLVVALDYVVAFAVLGLSGLFRHKKDGLLYAIIVCGLLRYVCHVLSGGIIWGPFYAWENWGIWPYSLAYNGLFMGAELIVLFVASLAILRKLPSITRVQGDRLPEAA